MTTIEQLQQTIEALQAEIEADMERLIEPKRYRLTELKSALRDKQIEGWFQANPDKRLSIGDYLKVTDEYRQLLISRAQFINKNANVATVAHISYPIDEYVSIVVNDGCGNIGIPHSIALRMRQAWLREHAT
jgi:hypothetical protein